MTTDEAAAGTEPGIEGFRTSPLQNRIWRTARHARSVVVLSVSGPVPTARIEASLRAATERHEMLRTSFRTLPELAFPLQVIHDLPLAGTRLTDLSGEDPAARAAALEALVEAHRRRTEDPAPRADLVTLSGADRQLVLSLPALCADAGTLLALCREVAEGCGTPGPAPEDPPQYADVTEWIHDVLDSPAGEAGRDYWATASAGLAPALAEPAANGTGAASTVAPTVASAHLDASDAELVDRAAAALGESTEVFLLTCWQILRWRAAPQGVPALGVLLDGRAHAELAHVLGPLTRCVPLTGRVDLAESFAALARRTGRALEEHREWQEHFDAAACCRSAGKPENAYFREVFGYTDARATWSAGGTTFAVELLQAEGEPSAGRLTCLRLPGGLRAELHRAPGAGGDAAPDATLLDRLRTLALSAARRPEAAVGALEWLGTGERRAIGAFSAGPALDSGGPAPEVPSKGAPGLFHERFAASALRHADRTALVFGDERLTYRELDERADHIAHRLAAAGVRPRQVVAVWTAPSPDLIAAVLGILKAGCAYLPLIPGESPSRAAGILSDSGAAALVVDRAPPPGLPLPAAAVLRTDVPQ
ncbi:AMP-binding protein, partial [Streptomyces sp. SBT349]|uniref:AMP-binding protein n=1 Tax=Streptomyces sp. SBT349 TaxID=1580539 RepID=UPI00066CAC01